MLKHLQQTVMTLGIPRQGAWVKDSPSGSHVYNTHTLLKHLQQTVMTLGIPRQGAWVKHSPSGSHVYNTLWAFPVREPGISIPCQGATFRPGLVLGIPRKGVKTLKLDHKWNTFNLIWNTATQYTFTVILSKIFEDFTIFLKIFLSFFKFRLKKTKKKLVTGYVFWVPYDPKRKKNKKNFSKISRTLTPFLTPFPWELRVAVKNIFF